MASSCIGGNSARGGCRSNCLIASRQSSSQPVSCISASVEQHVAFYLLSALVNLTTGEIERDRVPETVDMEKKQQQQRKKRIGERGEAGGVRASQPAVRWLCVRAVCEILVGWWSRIWVGSGPSRSSCPVSHLCLCPRRITWIEPSS